jgi:hypothetical protein
MKNTLINTLKILTICLFVQGCSDNQENEQTKKAQEFKDALQAAENKTDPNKMDQKQLDQYNKMFKDRPSASDKWSSSLGD